MARYNTGLDGDAGGYDTDYSKYVDADSPPPRLNVVGVKPQARYSDSWADIEFNRSVEKPRQFDPAQIEKPRPEQWKPGNFQVSSQNQR
jgi:hypothetical protein